MAPNPAGATTRIDEAFAKRDAALLAAPANPKEFREAEVSLDAVLSEAGFPPHEPKQADGSIVAFTDRPVRRVKDLDGTQRAFMEHVAGRAHRHFGRHPFPSADWAILRWLGLEPPGALFAEREGTTLYERIREAKRVDVGAAETMLRELPPLARIEVLCDLHLLRNDYGGAHVEMLLFETVDQIDATFESWAKGFASRLLAVDAVPLQQRSADIEALRLPTFLALVRGGVAIEERHDALFTLYDGWKPAVLQECIDAIPESRLEAAFLGALGRMMFTNDAVNVAAALLARHPYASIASFLLQRLDQSRRPKDALRAVKAAAKSHPAIAAALMTHETGKPPIRELRATSRKVGAPKLAELDALAKKQLEIASQRYDGKKRTAKQILAGEAGDDATADPLQAETIERIRIDDESGKHAYDAWLYMGDSGTIFAAGTTTVVAERIQAGLDAADKTLRMALLAALANEKKPRKTKKKASARKK